MTERLYEGLFLLDSNEAAKGWSDLESHVTGLLEKHSARIEYSERWPDQRLATEIKGVKKGTYFLTYFNAPTHSIAEMRRDFELSDRILRFLPIREEYTEEEMNRRRDYARRKPEPPPAPAPAAPAAEEKAAEKPADTPAEKAAEKPEETAEAKAEAPVEAAQEADAATASATDAAAPEGAEEKSSD